ncbi:MAG TPA: PIG-L deacetylase family protein [Gemmatimonadales bacterium]|nr:PIG-L deacetylase family protein [Gemmatimonadales bacterium]
MRSLELNGAGRPRRVLCLGAHADDIEIGCGGTVLQLADAGAVEFTWVVLSGAGVRADEARCAASKFLGSAPATVIVQTFRDGFFPYDGGEIKAFFEELKQQISPDMVFTHYRADRHQDHRVVSDLTWNTFRDHLILEYEIPKWDGDLGAPNCFVPLETDTCHRKVEHLLTAFRSQTSKRWFTPETFQSLLRLRGIESGAPSGYAEAFYAHKIVCRV